MSQVFAQEEPQTQAQELNMKELRRRILNEAPEELMSHSLGDADVSLFVTGTWYGELQANLGFYNSPIYGTGFTSPETPLLFRQEVDLTLALWINERWFVEASFLDDSSGNTYRAGYAGSEDEFIRYAAVGNTGLDFPSFPYLDLGGDSASSFGFYGRAGKDKIEMHTLVRYDAAVSDEKIFTGGRERTYTEIQPQNTLRGISFVLPNGQIDTEIIVYMEDEKGTILDDKGRRWRLALNSEYAASRTSGLVELSVLPGGMVAVSYGVSKPWTNSMGSYDGTPNGFLTKVQNFFDPSRSGINLASYPQCGGGTGRPGEVTVGTIDALVVYEPGTFSPFEKRSLYYAPSGNSEKASLIRLSNGNEMGGYELVHLENMYTENISAFSMDIRRRNIYEIVSNGSSDRRDPENLFPLAQEIPEIYLPGKSVYSGDIRLRFTNYNSVSGYFIGTDVIPGSVQVWRSGIQDPRFTYNSSSGEVAITGPVGYNEVIRITYLKTNEAIMFGSIAAGIGAIYGNAASPFSAQAAVGIRWNLTEDAFTEEGRTSAGMVGVGAKTAWDYDFLKAQITAGFAFVQTDTTGLYRAAGMEGNELILYLPYDRSFVSNQCYLQTDGKDFGISDRANLVYRNYYNNSLLGDTLMSVDWGGSTTVSGVNKPYPVKDGSLGNTQVLTAEFTLDGNVNWTGFQVPLGANAQIISLAGEIEIPFRLYGFTGDTVNMKLFIQIGSLSGMDFMFAENSDLIWEKEILSLNSVFDDAARIVRFTVNETEKQKLSDAKYLRLIAVYEGAAEVSGRVLLAPPIVKGSSFRAITYDGAAVGNGGDSVTVTEIKETGANTLESKYGGTVNRLHSVTGMQRVLKIERENNAGISAGVDGRIKELPLANYRELSFFVKGPNPENADGFLRFIVASGPDMIKNPQLEAKIPLSSLSANEWKKVTVRYNGKDKGVKVDGIDAGAQLPLYDRLKSSDETETSYIAFLIDPDASLSPGEKSEIFIDEIILEDPVTIFRMNAGTAVEYKREGTVLSVAGYPVIEDFKITTAVESEGRAENKTDDPNFTGSMFNRTGFDVSFLKTDISGNLSFTAAEETFLWDADHSISKKVGDFSVKETFYASPQISAAQHTVNMAYVSDFHARFKADALYDLSRLRQEWNLDTGYNPKNTLIPSALFTTNAAWTKKGKIEEDENYGQIWLKTWQPLVPDAGENAVSRRTSAQIVLTQRTKPVGAVLVLNGNTNYSGPNSYLRLENSAFLDIPVFLDKINLNFRMGRGFKRQHIYSGEDVKDDASMFFKSVEEGLSLWKIFPGYSLFAPELNGAIDGIDPAQYTSFNDYFGVRVNLPVKYNLYAFLVPSRFSFRMERVLEKKMDTKTDTLNLGGSLNFTAVNMFGAMGYRPIFKFYQSDEYSHGIEASVIIPKNEEVSWGISSVLGASFRGFSGGTLNFVNTLTVRSNDYWTESFMSYLEIPTKKSMLSAFYNWIVSSAEKQNLLTSPLSKKVFNTEYEQLRKASLELVFDKSTEYLRWNIVAGHEEIVRIIGRLNFTTFLKLRLGEDLYTDIFMFDVMLGTTLRLSF